MTDIGLEVEGMEEVESIPGGLKGVVVGHVVECGKHPNADKLSLTKVKVVFLETWKNIREKTILCSQEHPELERRSWVFNVSLIF